MEQRKLNTSIPVLLLHNLDLSWEVPDLKQAMSEVEFIEKSITKEGHRVVNRPIFDNSLQPMLADFNPDEFVVLNCCDSIPGVPHSEALVARHLDAMKFTYTGSQADSIELSWDKPKTKEVLQKNGLPTPEGRAFGDTNCSDWKCFPAIVKPALEHCSYGLTSESVVTNHAELKKRIKYILDSFAEPALVEDFIDGREFHVTVWGNGAPEILPAVEMDFKAFSDFHDRLCTYDSKFTPNSRHYTQIESIVPAVLTPEEQKSLETIVMKAYGISGCRDYARFDLRLRDGIFYVLDVNPNPDIGYDASMASAAELVGYPYGKMISSLVNFAAARHPVFKAQVDAPHLTLP